MSKPFVFTLMPFSPNFDDIYKLGIKSTCEELNSYCERVDEQIFQGSIIDRIINQISKADVIVADMTGRNPNVFFEVGFAKALDKKLILLTSNVEDIPFDLKHYTHVVYDGSIIKLKDKLKTHLQYYFAYPDKKQSEMLIGVNLYVCGIKLLEGNVTKVEVPATYHYIALTIENVSGRTLEPNSLRVTARTDDHWLFGRNEKKKYVIDRENKEKWAIFNDDPIFHGSEDTFELCHPASQAEGCKFVEIDIFTRSGQGSYVLQIVRESNQAETAA